MTTKRISLSSGASVEVKQYDSIGEAIADKGEPQILEWINSTAMRREREKYRQRLLTVKQCQESAQASDTPSTK